MVLKKIGRQDFNDSWRSGTRDHYTVLDKFIIIQLKFEVESSRNERLSLSANENVIFSAWL